MKQKMIEMIELSTLFFVYEKNFNKKNTPDKCGWMIRKMGRSGWLDVSIRFFHGKLNIDGELRWLIFFLIGLIGLIGLIRGWD